MMMSRTCFNSVRKGIVCADMGIASPNVVPCFLLFWEAVKGRWALARRASEGAPRLRVHRGPGEGSPRLRVGLTDREVRAQKNPAELPCGRTAGPEQRRGRGLSARPCMNECDDNGQGARVKKKR